MPKFRIRLKVQGLELEVDGERQDLPAITQAVQNQLTGIVIAPEAFTDASKQLTGGNGANGAGGDQDEEGKKKQRRERRSARTGGGEGAEPLEFRHDAAKYGNPVQAWTLEEKCIWLLYVLKKSADVSEVSGPVLAATFNKYFKPTGRVHPPHVTIKLAKKKMENPTPIGQDKENYYLTEEGDKQAQQLIGNVLHPA